MSRHAAESSPIRLATLIAVALISAALLAYEVLLMQRLLIERWHHFGYLVISAALLGFGASGTLLALIERRVRARPTRTMFVLAVVTALTLLILPRVATLVPATARFIPQDLWPQIGWWSLYWLTALVPFLAGAALLGAALMTAGRRLGGVYAANLFGSAAGAAGAMLIVARLPLEHSLWPSLSLCIAAVFLLSRRRATGLFVGLVLAALAVCVGTVWPLRPAYDEHKYAARLAQLVTQGSARRVAVATDPHGYVELYESELFHDLPLLALSTRPPPMYRLVINGDPAASVLRIDDACDAEVMDHTLMALPYRLIRPRPRVLLIGEMGGINIWLARRQDAAQIDAVQPNAAVARILRDHAPALFDDPRLDFHAGDPRQYLTTLDAQACDLIQIVSLEGLGAGSAGMRGLAEDHLATTEGFAAALRALRDDGILAVSRGIQQPPRENVRLFALLAEALESLGVAEPAQHLIQVRDYLGVCTLASRSPLTIARRADLEAAIAALQLTPVWYDGLPIESVNQRDALPGPPDSHVDWLHHAAREVLSPRREQFYDDWLLNVRPPHDDSPFFWDFFKPQAVAPLRQSYGDLWLTRAELGRLFLYASLLIAAATALVLILLPLALMQRPTAAAHRGELPPPRHATVWTVTYFGAIGAGFMGIEMALISRAIRWLGDPVIASAAVIGGVLVVSGLGSLSGRRIVRHRTWLAPAAVALAAAAIRLVGWHVPSDGLAGAVLLLAVTLPATYFMGMPLPAGVGALDARSPRLVPWAWGVNGVASVLATSAAIIIAMSTGYRTVMLLAVAMYALAALAGVALNRPRGRALDPTPQW